MEGGRMSDTPRTEAVMEFIYDRGMTEWVPADLARQLERELNETQSLVAEITHGITHSPYCCESLPCMRCERDTLRARVAELEAVILSIIATAEDWQNAEFDDEEEAAMEALPAFCQIIKAASEAIAKKKADQPA